MTTVSEYIEILRKNNSANELKTCEDMINNLKVFTGMKDEDIMDMDLGEAISSMYNIITNHSNELIKTSKEIEEKMKNESSKNNH